MKVQFVCKTHDVNLLGYPLWELMDPEDMHDRYTISFRDMHCPENPDMNVFKCNRVTWEAIVE